MCRIRVAPFEAQVKDLEGRLDMSTNCTPAARITRSLLGYGVIAGPLYVMVSLAQALTRDGFDPTRHAWSLLSNGDYGWIQITNFIVTGLMTVAGAGGPPPALAPGPGRTLAPAPVGGHGAGPVGAAPLCAGPPPGLPPR